MIKVPVQYIIRHNSSTSCWVWRLPSRPAGRHTYQSKALITDE